MDINIVFLGGKCSGKTQLINVSCGSKFYFNSPPTLGYNCSQKSIKIKNIEYNLFLWDTSGREYFRSTNRLLLKQSNFFILVYNITSKVTFENIKYWYDEIKNSGKENPIIGIVGTHLDLFLQEEVGFEIAENFANSIGAKFTVISASKDIEPFNKMLKELTIDYIEYEKKNRNFKNTLLKYYNY